MNLLNILAGSVKLSLVLVVVTSPAFADKDEIPPPPGDWGSNTSSQPNAIKPQYHYKVPLKLSDGWKVGNLRKEKADLDKVTGGVDRILAGIIPDVHSLVVLRHGKILLDEYFSGQKEEDAHPLFSCTKSVFSTVYGIAQDQGFLNLDQKIADLYPDARTEAGWDHRKDAISIGMLLSMTSGLDCNDAGTGTPCYSVMSQSRDWLAFCLGLPLVHPPGTFWTYNGSCLTLLANLIAKKSGMSFSSFADKVLLEPLGIPGNTWVKGPNETNRVDYGLNWKSRDMAKLGQLYLNKGLWKGKRVVSEAWVKDATAVHAPPGGAFGHDYGYLWHIKTLRWKGRPIQMFYANGYMGQAIFVSPDADVVCVMTAGSGDPRIYGMEEGFFEDSILGSFN